VHIRFGEASPWLRMTVSIMAVAGFLVGSSGCSPKEGRDQPGPATLRIGFGLTSGETAEAGVQHVIRLIALEGLIAFRRDGRPQPSLAESWSRSPDGLKLSVRLKPNLVFHNGQPVTAESVRQILVKQLPDYMGPAFSDIDSVSAISDHDIEIRLRRRSNFVLEGLDVQIEAPGPLPVGTGPFAVTSYDDTGVQMRANDNYHQGRPLIDALQIKPYASLRSAWADMLRGDLDMLYEVGLDALDSLQPSTDTEVYTFPRRYAFVIILNVARPEFRDAEVRRQLNGAIDRNALIDEVLQGHGEPAEGPVWPSHWAYDPKWPKFRYAPKLIATSTGRVRFRLLVPDSSLLERLVLAVQKQLQAVGVDVEPELVPLDQVYGRIRSGNFDALLADAISGPTLLRPSWFWESGTPYNWGHYTNPKVDAALDAVRQAPDDDAYKAGVGVFQRAIVDDPPAIFLAWSERARAVSTRFEVPVEPERDILSTLRLWRPVAGPRNLIRN
jgi:peptide/nickel transport system substrate-binding protein